MTINNRGAEWLEARGLSVDTAVRMGLYTTSRPGGEPTGEEAADWIAVPYMQGEECVNTKFRKLSEKRHSQTEGGKQIVWNRAAIRDPGLQGEPLIITEGEWDALAAIEAGFQRVVSVPGGAPAERGTARHAYIDEAWNDFRDVKVIIIATDADDPGCNLRDDLIARFGPARCQVVKFPKGCKDLGDALRDYGVKGVKAALKTAQFIPVDGVVDLDSLPEAPPLNPLKLTDLGDDFRDHIGLCKGHLSVWTGEANGGKTALLRQVAWAATRQAGWRIGAAWFEDNIRQNFVPAMTRIILNGRPETDADQERANRFIQESFKFILPPDGDTATVPYMLEMAETAVRRYGCNLIIVDPWTELDLELAPGRSETEAAKVYLTAIKHFARRFNVHFALIAHPRKPPDFGGVKRMPDGYDISGSAHFKNKCDLGVTVQAHGKIANVSTVRVWKSKYKEEMGYTGDFHLMFDPSSRRFSYLPRADFEDMQGQLDTGVVNIDGRRKSSGRKSNA